MEKLGPGLLCLTTWNLSQDGRQADSTISLIRGSTFSPKLNLGLDNNTLGGGEPGKPIHRRIQYIMYMQFVFQFGGQQVQSILFVVPPNESI